MASKGLQMAGCAMGLLGWIGVLIVCCMPIWRVMAFRNCAMGLTLQVVWEGIWMVCITQRTGQLQCKVYDSMLALSNDLQAARVLVVVSIVIGIAGIFIAFVSGKCTNFIPEARAKARAKARASVAAGVLLIISGLLCLIAVSWTAGSIIRNFNNPLLVDAQKIELGASLYIGWGAGALLLLGGALLCASCPPKEDKKPSVKYLLNNSGGNDKEESIYSFTPDKTYI